MDHHPPPAEYTPTKLDQDERPPVMQAQEQQSSRDSSSEDVPLRHQRPRRAPESPHTSSHLHSDTTLLSNTSLLSQLRATHRATLPNSSPSPPKARKKPGPRPWASKPLKKNDLAAKQEVIREIEQYWGKGFIRAYVPKCHRPLVKRDKSGKRTACRTHEADPSKWLPSVLKAVRSIAALTANKVWLRKAMNDVVRYRIKHTGNRKPQLVTTDFDVLEDMLIKDWDVEFSFDIRYKHLLTNSQGQQETDQDIDHILGAVSSEEGSGEEDDDDVEGGTVNGQDDEDVERDDIEDATGGGHLSAHHLQTNGYTNALHHPHPHHTPAPPPKQQKGQLEKRTSRASNPPTRPHPSSHIGTSAQASIPAYPYGPPLDLWGRPMLYSGGPEGYSSYPRYNMCNSHDAPTPPPRTSNRLASYPGMFPRPPRTDSPYVPDSPLLEPPTRRIYNPSSSPFHTPRLHLSTPAVKQESPDCGVHSDADAREVSAAEWAAPTTEMGVDVDANAAALEAELRATELELKVARLQARRVALRQRSMGG